MILEKKTIKTSVNISPHIHDTYKTDAEFQTADKII